MNHERANQLTGLIQQLDEVWGHLHDVMVDEGHEIDNREPRASDRETDMLLLLDTAYGSLAQVIRDLEEIVGDHWRRQERQAARRIEP